jgi:hypothetical protein
MKGMIADTKDLSEVEKKPWFDAASQWRLPYWDYAANPKIPDIAGMPTVSIKTLSGKQKTFDPNPVWTYRMSQPMGKLPKPYTIHQADGIPVCILSARFLDLTLTSYSLIYVRAQVGMQL